MILYIEMVMLHLYSVTNIEILRFIEFLFFYSRKATCDVLSILDDV